MQFYSKTQSTLCEKFVQQIELDSYKTIAIRKIESDIKKLESTQHDIISKLQSTYVKILLSNSKNEVLNLFINM